MPPENSPKHFHVADVMALATKFKLNAMAGPYSLSERLDGSAEVYFDNKNGVDSIEPNQDVREQLRALSKSIQSLQARWRGLSPAALLALRKEEKSYEQDVTQISLGMDSGDAPPVQIVTLDDKLKFIRITLPDGEGSDIAFNQRAISDALVHFEAFASAAQKNLVTRTKGRRNSMSLRLWVRNIESIWRDHRGEPFHVTYLAGHPKSEAACFCADALKIIDPQIPTSKIVTEMRKFVTEEKGKNLKK